MNLILILDYSIQKDVIKEIIKEEDEYKNNNFKNSEENMKNKNVNINKDKDNNDNDKFKKENNFRLIDNKINADNNLQKLSMKDLNQINQI